MTIYRIHRRGEDGTSSTCAAGTRKSRSRDNPNPEPHGLKKIEVEVNALGILHALNRYGGHPDNE